MKYTKILLMLVIVFVNISLFADWIEQQKILASDGFTEDFFGNSVAIDGDYAVVGAPIDDDNGSASGSVYIFQRIDNVWTEQAKITASDGEGSDIFGNSVSIDGNFIIVGANWSDDNGTMSGSAYIFKRIGNTWLEVDKLTASNAGAMDEFGYSVSISGDYAVVGAYKNEVNGIGTGSAYVFKRTGDNWVEQVRLNSSDAEDGDLFGFSVSIDGTYIVVGAYDGDYSGFHPSYIFHRIGNVWNEQAILLPNDRGGYCFGKSVAINGDYALIGAYTDNVNGSKSGSAYIFHRTGTTWIQQAKITPSDGSANDYFGLQVSISGDYALIGALNNDDYGSNSGSAYIFHRAGQLWSEQKLLASDGEGGDLFGYSVCIDDEYGIIGAKYDDDNGEDSGSAYIFQNNTVSIGDDNIQYSTENLQLNNFPNPFNPETTISFSLTAKDAKDAKLVIYNVKGQKVKHFSDLRNKTSVNWDGKDESGKELSTGTYFIEMKADGKIFKRKMTLVK